ncbi:MAG TPA: hypothetical protein VMH61_04325 [Candidatus Acidoferrales bacterium]|nr:hypothetical protein [Candidatus Acidoferrales bacterium]
MKRRKSPRRERRVISPRLRLLPRVVHPRVNGRVALSVMTALGRLAQRLGPAT